MDKTSYCLSDDDIRNFFGGKVKILTFRDIGNYDTIDDLLKPWGRVVILFEKSKHRGHWCCLFRGTKKNDYIGARDNDFIYFFDPYGIKPEGQLRFSSGMNRYLKQRRDTLIRLFDGHMIKYNDVPLQKWKKNVSSCGRWCLSRVSCNNLNSYEFADLIKSQTDDPDQFITNVTNKFLIK